MRKIAFQGTFGANSDMACRSVFPHDTTLPCLGFEDAFVAVRKGDADLAMIAVENSLAGRVADVHYLLPQGGLHIVGEHFQPITHHLLGIEGAKVADIKRVESHVQALAQCRNYLRTHKIEPVIHADTAGAAEKISKLGDKTVAAIAPKLAGELYGLETLATNIADRENNTTRFLILAREVQMPPSETPSVTTLIFRVRSVPAALYKALGVFATNGVNLTKLESYLVDNSFAAAQFYVDVEGHSQALPLQRALVDLKSYVEEIKILGTYPAHPFRTTGKL